MPASRKLGPRWTVARISTRWTGTDWASLHIVAAVNPDSAVMRLLLDQGADIMTLDARGRMPLHWAAGFNSLEMVSPLIDSGSEVHGLDERGETPLHSAAATNPDPRVADLLLDNGAQLDGETEHGRTPLSKAVNLQRAGGGRRVPAGPRGGHRGGGRVGFRAPASGGLFRSLRRGQVAAGAGVRPERRS